MKRLLLALLLTASIFGAFFTIREIIRLSSENERLRIYNSRQTRARMGPEAWCKKYGWDAQAVAVASDLTACPPEVILAIWGFEKGPPGYEFGNRGRTDLFVRHLPPAQFQYAEAGRSMNQFAWEWFQTTPEGKRALPLMVRFCGMRYGGPSDAERILWGKNVLLNIERFKVKP